ncbi:MAG: carboxypeptidase-like regulatory domain-containing protein [Parafilimonas sp.]
MAEQNQHINYSLPDIERYLNGGMSAREMHELEKAALHDPFLADAIEGYSKSSLPLAHKHLNELNAMLHGEKRNAKVISISVKNTSLWRIAAMVIITAGVGVLSWYVINLNNNPSEQNVALVKEKAPSESKTIAKDSTTNLMQAESKTSKEKETVTQQQIDVSKIKREEADKNGVAEQNGNIEYKLMKDSVAKRDEVADVNPEIANVPSSVFNTPAPDKSLERKAAGVEIKDESYPAKSRIAINPFRGRITDNNFNPIPHASVNINKGIVLTDANGYFNINASDTIVNATVSSIGYESRIAKISSNNSNNITLAPSKQSLDEVVVTGYGVKKSTNKNAFKDSLATPLGGWQSFQKYIDAKMDSLNIGETIEGEVELEFLIDKQGNPYNFRLIKSLDEESNSKAIEILKAGPRWISLSKNRKARVSMHF